MSAALAPPDLGEEDIPFNAKRGQILFEGPHPLPDFGYTPLEFRAVE